MRNLLQLPQSLTLIESLPVETRILWKYFLFCTETPRPSGKLDVFRQKLIQVAQNLSCEALIDNAGNVVIRKQATKGYENAPAICIQAHMDMVCSKNSSSNHDFDKDPIRPQIEGEWMKATETTLGADDGIGVAACLALLEEKDLPHGPLECLLTSDEETDMSGAENLLSSTLRSRILINVDSEKENSICIGCAGGFDRSFHLPLNKFKVNPSTNTTSSFLKISLMGLNGGHTGIQIHEGLGNAIKLLNRIVRPVIQKNDGVGFHSLNGGTAINSIPRECFTVLSVPSHSKSDLIKLMDNNFQLIKKEYQSLEKNISFSISEVTHDTPQDVCDNETSKKIVNLISTIPHGVVRMSPQVSGLVETSNSLSIVNLEEKELVIQTFARSSSDSQMESFEQDLQSVSQLSGAAIQGSSGFPGWQPNTSSKCLEVVRKVHNDLFSIDPEVYAIHAGLECGYIIGKYPDMDCVSIGPEIREAHTPEEKIHIPSATKFYNLLKEVVKTLSQEKQ